MDFKRIELIFFWAFLSLNLFLVYTYNQGQVERVPLTESTSVIPIEQRLTADKIKFPEIFSKVPQTGYYLSAEASDFSVGGNQLTTTTDNHRLSQHIERNPQYMLERGEIDGELKALIAKDTELLFSKDYRYINKKASDGLTVVFTQQFEELPFNDDTSELIFELEETSKNKLAVIGYTQTHLREIEPLREKQPVITESDAIETLYTSNKILSESSIIRTQLAYTRIFTVRGKNVYIPAWFVWIENPKKNVQIERINAFSNSYMSANVPEVKK